MATIKLRVLALSALAALIVGLSCAVANAAKKDGNYFEIAPYCCQPGMDLRTVLGIELSTADAAVTNGILKLTTIASNAIYTDGTYWISNGQYGASGTVWSATNGEALRKDFADWPTYRAKVRFLPASQCTGYLAAYSSRGKLMVQKTFTSSDETVLDTGALRGRIGYILATFDGECGRLGNIGYYHNLH
jgi:hypothetical protein